MRNNGRAKCIVVLPVPQLVGQLNLPAHYVPAPSGGDVYCPILVFGFLGPTGEEADIWSKVKKLRYWFV